MSIATKLIENRRFFERVRCSSSIPLFPLCTSGGLDFHWCLFNLIPVGAQGGTTTFRIALHHSSLGVFISVGENLLEKAVESAVSSNVGIFVGAFLFLATENFCGNSLPILSRFTSSGPCLRRCCGVTDIGEC